MPARVTGDYDAVMLVSFGGPEGIDDVVPFLERVTAGRNVPAERLAVVAEQYALFDGVSPINQNNRDLLDALKSQLEEAGIDLPVYWGNRNWHPLLVDTVQQMADHGHQRVLALVTSAFGSYSGCRQYSEDIDRAVAAAGTDMVIHKARLYWNHPGFLDAMIDRTAAAFDQLDELTPSDIALVFTAHSIPRAWTTTAPYLDQLQVAAQYVADRAAPATPWSLAFQSRSGPPTVPWLEPDIGDHLGDLHQQGVRTVVVSPIGFVSDHMEVVYDLDTLASGVAEGLGMTMIRARTAGIHPAMVGALTSLVDEATRGTTALCAVGQPWPNPCATDCCQVETGPPRRN